MHRSRKTPVRFELICCPRSRIALGASSRLHPTTYRERIFAWSRKIKVFMFCSGVSDGARATFSLSFVRGNEARVSDANAPSQML